MSINEDVLNELVGRFAGDFAAAAWGSTVLIGDKLGLYKTLAAKGPLTAPELAATSGYDERLVEDWANAQFVSGYCEYDASTGAYHLSEEQIALLADDSTPAFLVGAMEVVAAMYKDEGTVREAFRTGNGVPWSNHDHDLFHGVERMFKAGYVGNLVSAWIPSLDGVEAKLRAGSINVADVGCGFGASTILLAKEYPNATIIGFDSHEPSIVTARERAAEAGVGDRVRFQVASAQDFPGNDYDLVCIFDALHDMGDPLGAARHIRDSLADGGTWMLVEPAAGDDLLANVSPVGRAFYSGSISICTPCAQAQPGGYALGNQVPDARWREILVDEAGFTQFRRATETPFNRVFEVRA